MDFNPRAPCGARLYSHFNPNPCGKFQSTRPVRGATASGHSFCPVTLFQSTRPVRGATIFQWRYCDDQVISIHAPRAGRDLPVSIRSCGTSLFQSTRPVRGATYFGTQRVAEDKFQSTRPVRGATMVYPP